MAGLSQFSINSLGELPKLFGMKKEPGAQFMNTPMVGGGLGGNQGGINLGTKQLARLAGAYATMQSALPNKPFDPNANLRNEAEAMQLKLAKSNALAGMNANRQAMNNRSLIPGSAGARRGSGGGGALAPSSTPSLSQQPYQSDLGKDRGTGIITDNEMNAIVGKSALPTPGNPLANLSNPAANQASLAATAATPATAANPMSTSTRGSGTPPGIATGLNQKNMDIAKGLDPTGGNNFLSGVGSEASAVGGMGGPALPGTPPAGTNATMDQKNKKPGKGKGK